MCSGILKSLNIETFEQCKNTLKKASNNENSIFEVIFKYHIKKNENFLMQPHFKSFQNIKKGTFLATSNGERIFSQYTAQLFMPLYQKSGDDGFFIVRSISPFFLKLSALLRKIKADNLLTLLPGISWENKDLGILKANLNVTRYLAKSIFHLFGYRNKQIDKTHLLLYNRERVAKRQLYQHEKWYKKTTTY